MNQLVYNAIQTPDGTILESIHRHDYKTYKDTLTNNEYMIDGGGDYQRMSMNGDEINLAVYSDEPFEKVREVAFRLGYGKPGSEDYGTLRLTRFKNMDDEYLQESIKYVERKHHNSLESIHFQLLKKELQYRLDNNITVKETICTFL